MRNRFIASLVLVATTCSRGDDRAVAPERSRTPASTRPDAVLFDTTPDAFDRLVRSGDQPTVVNVWASWCIPCRSEMPLIRDAAARYAGRVRFLGLNTQDVREDALSFAREFRITFPSARDPVGAVARRLRVLGLPTTFFYRANGELAFVQNGEIRADGLESKIQELLRTDR